MDIFFLFPTFEKRYSDSVKKFRAVDLKALHKSNRSGITRHIKIAKTLYYGRQFPNDKDIKFKRNVTREIGTGGKCPQTGFDAEVNKLNDQFVHSKVPG